MHADRALITCALANRLDLITNQDVDRALRAWVDCKEKSISTILSELGALTPDAKQLLDHAVDRHIAQHGNDMERSLTSVGATVAEFVDILESSGDEELRRLLRFGNAWTATIPAVSEGIDRRLYSFPNSTRYCKIVPHAKGGLGEVYIAHDIEVHRRVALKEIQARFANNQDCCERFEFEAVLTGSLEHPSIVPIYGVGRYSDGRPYYAMKFIEGDSLSNKIRQLHTGSGITDGRNRLNAEGRSLLTRFVSVCQAIDYAHSRGVIHRDLKPANIMLGAHGETLVVDWGLAKRLSGDAGNDSTVPDAYEQLGRDLKVTLAGSTVGTPAYMSPEQGHGKLHELGPLTDVFGLGATLYSMLTGRPPYESKGSAELFYTQVQEGKFPTPRSLKKDIPAPLEAICLKAMALKQTDRYCSAKELARDVEAFLADERVDAFKESIVARIMREFRRDLGSALLVCVVAVFGFQFLVFSILKNVSPVLFDEIVAVVGKYSAAIRFGIVAGTFTGFIRSQLSGHRSLATTARNMMLYGFVFVVIVFVGCRLWDDLREWFSITMQQSTGETSWIQSP